MNSNTFPTRNDEIILISTTNEISVWSDTILMANGGSSSSILSGRLLGVTPTKVPCHVVQVSSSNTVDGSISTQSVKRFNNGENKTPLLPKRPIIRQTPTGTTMFVICTGCGKNSKNLDFCEHCSTSFESTRGFSPNSKAVNSMFKHSIKPNILTKPVLFNSKPNVLTKQTFYGTKLHEAKPFQRASSVKAVQLPVISGNQQYKRPPSKLKREPVCLTISSDEEPDENDKSISSEIENRSDSVSVAKEIIANRVHMIRDKDGQVVNDKGEPIQVKPIDSVRIECRSIRIGSYKVHYQGPINHLFVDVTKDSIRFTVPTVTDVNSQVLLTISIEDIPSMLACFDKKLFVIYIYTTSGLGGIIRTRLQMTKSDEFYYDPLVEDETQKRITIIPATLAEHHITFLREIFQGGKMKEISQADANELLVRSTPQGAKQHMIRLTPAANTRAQAVIQQATSSTTAKTEVKKLLTYPPAPQTGGIEVTSEDFLCLNDCEFLNDVIIDFYLKYLLTEVFSELDQKRTYIFSSFFFNRLTQKITAKSTTKNASKPQSCQEARHSRVKTWTRHVDIFEKDFLIVPVNQTSHWFLAIICFPGLVSESSRLKNMNAAATAIKKTQENGVETNITKSLNESTVNEAVNDSTATGDLNESQTTNEEPQNIEADDDFESPLPHDTSFQSCSEQLDNSVGAVTSSTEIGFPSESRVMAELAKDYAEVDESVSIKPVADHRLEHSYSSPSIKRKIDIENANLGSIGDEKEPCIIIFDSLPGTPRWRIVQSLREYIQVEYQIKKGPNVTFDRYSMKGLSARVPRQTNFHDCGVYLLQYVECFLGKPFRVKSPLPVLDNWFTEEDINKKRQEIKELILNLQKKSSPSAAAQ